MACGPADSLFPPRARPHTVHKLSTRLQYAGRNYSAEARAHKSLRGPSGLVRGAVLGLLVCSVGISACEDQNPVRPTNKNPSIKSLIAFPSAIAPSDSVIVACQATDLDGDSLVYDWITDARLIPRDARPGDFEVYNTPSSTQVFHRSTVTPISDTAWVRCYVRDLRGGVDTKRVKYLAPIATNRKIPKTAILRRR